VKLLHAADLHVGLANYGRDVDEFGETLVQFARIAVQQEVDAAVLSGDTFHGRRPGPRELRYASQAVKILRDAGIDLIVGTGNHDGKTTIADPDSQTLGYLSELELPGVHVGVRPTVMEVGGLAVAMLPYAHRRSIEDPLLTLRQRTDEASRVLGETITRMADALDKLFPDLPHLFVGHLTTEFAKLGSEAAMMMGWDTTVDPEVFERYDYAALGHIHVGQQVSPNAAYPGSPDVHGFGEVAADKRFLLVDVSHGILPTVTAIPTNPRPLLRVEWSEEHDEMVGEVPVGAIVQLILHPKGKMGARVARDLVAKVRAAGAMFVVTQVVEPEGSRLRARAMEAESPVADQIDAWLASQTLSDDQRARARSIALRAVAHG
jgi:DNA repair protein SbcD/Mre11